ncbi:MAG: hypothetical protein VKL97_04855 [Cyanobacteriota bacterium]|nr:hypothetical protein [Cyanobacteriota bacterium]
MSQLTVKLSDRADALIAQLQKEIFNRRRKKVSAAGVIETLVESGAKSQSDKRFATSWKNLVSDIEKAAKVADAHGAKPANLSDEEWALVLSHRTRTPRVAAAKKPAARKAAVRKPAARKAAALKAATPKAKPAKRRSASAAKAKPDAAAAPAKPAARKPVARKTAARKPAARKPAAPKAAARKPAARKPVAKAARSTSVSTKGATSSVARRMAKAVSRLSSATPAVASSNGALKQPLTV